MLGVKTDSILTTQRIVQNQGGYTEGTPHPNLILRNFGFEILILKRELI
jgi:hypothetical protein